MMAKKKKLLEDFAADFSYAVLLQWSIEYHCAEKVIPAKVVKLCSVHATMLNKNRDENKQLKTTLLALLETLTTLERVAGIGMMKDDPARVAARAAIAKATTLKEQV